MLGEQALAVAFSWQGLRSRPIPLARPRASSNQFAGATRDFSYSTCAPKGATPGEDSTSQLVDEAQLAALEAFLLTAADLQAVFVAMSVPFVHIPEWTATTAHTLPLSTSDLDDRWPNPRWRDTRGRQQNPFGGLNVGLVNWSKTLLRPPSAFSS